MKLSNIAKQILQEESLEEIEDVVKQECAHYIQKNRQFLSSGFHLMRGTEYGGDLARRGFREREVIKGSSFLYYLFETMKPQNVPSRKTLVPCTGGEVSSFFENNYVYAVFPIGSSYKMVYTEGIEDFNHNDLNNDVYKVMDPFNEIEMEYWLADSGKREMDQDVFKDIGYVIGEIDALINSKKPDNIVRGYNYLFDYLEENRNNLKEEIPEIYDQIEESRKYMSEFLNKTNVSETLRSEMGGLEVGLYAPDGFIYVSEDKVNAIDWG